MSFSFLFHVMDEPILYLLLIVKFTVIHINNDLNPMIGNVPSLLSGGVNTAAAAAAANVCGNQDFLTNLLVYQYLSGNIPSGAAGANPQLAALLGSQVRVGTLHHTNFYFS